MEKSTYLFQKEVNKMKKVDFGNDRATNEWLTSLKKGTRNAYATHWKNFLEFCKMSGDAILTDRKNDTEHRWERKVLAFKHWLLEDKGYSTNTATAAAMAVRGFFGFHYMPLKYRREERKQLKERRIVMEDYHFTVEDLRKMVEVADLTEKYVILAGKSFGLRASDFIHLTRGHLEPYLDRESPIFIGKISTIKESVPAYPFIDSDALPVIKLMIQKMNREGRVDPAERILKFKERELSRILQRVTKKAGINIGNKQVRFHCLRKFLCDHLASVMAESKWKQIVGKTISEGAYISHEQLREDYKRAMAKTTIFQTTSQEDIKIIAKKEALLAIARSMGFTDEEMKVLFTKVEADQIRELERFIQRRQQPMSGGMPFETRASEVIAKILMEAFEKMEKKIRH